MTKWEITPVVYSPSSGETIATAWQKQIKIDNDILEFLNRLRVLDASPGSNIYDSEAFQFKINTTDKTLLIRNAKNSEWILCGYIDKDYFGITPETIYAVKNNGGVNSMEVVTQEPSGGSNGNIAIDTENKKLYQKINGVWTLLLSLSASDMLDYANLIKNNGGDIGKISIVNSTPSGGANGDIAIDITNKRMYQKNSNTWNLIFSLRASDLSDYDNLITQEDVSATAQADKIPRADSTGKLPNDIAGSPDKIADKKIISDAMVDGTTPVYRSSADGGNGGLVFEKVAASSVIDDTQQSISTTYSSSKISDLIGSILDEKLPELENKIMQERIYAVGKPFISFTDSRNPAEILGFGTWEKLAAGHTLVSAGNVQTEKYTHNFVAGETGGEFVHQLTVGELPEHTHTGAINSTNLVGTISYVSQGGNPSGIFARNSTWNTHIQAKGYDDDWGRNVTLNATHPHNVTISNEGGNNAHNNMMPYIATYIWKRID